MVTSIIINLLTDWGRDKIAAISQTTFWWMKIHGFLLKMSLKFVCKVRINNIPAMVQIMVRRRPGDKPLSGSLIVNLLTHIYITGPQWVNGVAFIWRDTSATVKMSHIKSASTMVSQLSLGRSLTEDLYNPKRIYMSIDSGSKLLTWAAHANCNAFPRVNFPPTLARDPVGHFEHFQIITCMFYMTGIHSPNLQAKNAKAGERTINSSHKPSSAPSKYTTMHHFATEMYISVTKW